VVVISYAPQLTEKSNTCQPIAIERYETTHPMADIFNISTENLILETDLIKKVG